jgi:phospholipase C
LVQKNTPRTEEAKAGCLPKKAMTTTDQLSIRAGGDTQLSARIGVFVTVKVRWYLYARIACCKLEALSSAGFGKISKRPGGTKGEHRRKGIEMARKNVLSSPFRLMSLAGGLLMTLNACGGGSSGSTQMTPDFEITATALSPATVTAGGSATSTVTIAAVNGFTGTVALACSGLPSEASCSFNPASVAGSGTSQLTIATAVTTPAGNSSLGVQGSSGSINHTAPLTLAVQSKIQHVVIIFQENRTPDNLFHDQNLINAGADIASSGKNSQGQQIPLAQIALSNDYDLSHKHDAFVEMYDDGKMDGADKIAVNCAPGATSCPPPNPQFQYVNPSDVAPYFQMAETYTFSDRMFQTNQGPSFPAHQFILSGTSAPTPPGMAMSDFFAAENPEGLANSGDDNNDTGCTAPTAEYVWLIDPNGVESQKTYPCYDHPTLTDLLDSAKLSWRYYAPLAGSIWTAPNAIKHMCVPDATGQMCTGSDWTQNVILNSSQVLTDIGAGQLAAVTWVIPTGKESDHAMLNDGSGPSWVASVVNAIGNSPFWGNTAIIITWDDWGGWYDHVPPPSIISSYEYGFRVPLIVVSPYAKAKHISHQVNDFGSILKFIEGTFGLSQVAPGASPAYADAVTTSNDLSDCFDFSQTPITFKTINAALKAEFFIHDKRPATPPDDD